MDNVNQQKDVGYLLVKVSTARGAIPLENAAINVRGSSPEDSGVIYSLKSDRDGLSERIALPAPPRSASQSPGEQVPYSLWNIDVFKEGYIPVSYQNVPVYSSIVSVQPAVMIPAGERIYAPTSVSESEAPRI